MEILEKGAKVSQSEHPPKEDAPIWPLEDNCSSLSGFLEIVPQGTVQEKHMLLLRNNYPCPLTQGTGL